MKYLQIIMSFFYSGRVCTISHKIGTLISCLSEVLLLIQVSPLLFPNIRTFNYLCQDFYFA